MRVGIAAGHSEITEDPLRLAEHLMCRRVERTLFDLLQASGPRADLAIELHLNRGGGSYSAVLHHPTSTDANIWLAGYMSKE